MYVLGCLWHGKLFANCNKHSCHEKQLPVKHINPNESLCGDSFVQGAPCTWPSQMVCATTNTCLPLLFSGAGVAVGASSHGNELLTKSVISCSPISSPSSPYVWTIHCRLVHSRLQIHYKNRFRQQTRQKILYLRDHLLNTSAKIIAWGRIYEYFLVFHVLYFILFKFEALKTWKTTYKS